MADPTSLLNFGSNPFEIDTARHEFIIKTSEALVCNAFTSVAIATGKVEFADDVADLCPCGIVLGSSDGIASHLTGNGTYKAVCRGGIIIQYAVTGATAKTDIGKEVYATDGQTLTLTEPTAGMPHGKVVDWVSSTTCKVYLYTFLESLQKSFLSPSQYFIKEFGIFPTNALQGTAALTLHTGTSYEHYKIISLHAACAAFDNAAVAGSQALNLDIGGTNVTGGVLTVAYTDVDAAGDMGVAINATAITAANEVHMGDTLTLEMAASGTGFTADCAAAVRIFAKCQRIAGA